MKTELFYVEESNRILCIEKDIIELLGWIEALTQINEDISYFKLFDNQLIKNIGLTNQLISFRRRNTLLLASNCTYEKELKQELAYGKNVYNKARARVHEKKRDEFIQLLKDFTTLKNIVYKQLVKFKR